MRAGGIPAATIGIVLAGGAVLGALAGCGGRFDLPTEHRVDRFVPSDKSYQMMATWHLDGTRYGVIRDLLLTQGSGSQLFLLYNSGGSGIAARGRVLSYPLLETSAGVTPNPISGIDFRALFNPVALASGGDGLGGANNRIYVLDAGDTCLARANPSTFTCSDTTNGWDMRINDLQHYWRVREYRLLGGDTLSTFSDTTLAAVNGIAADASGNVYVSGLAIVLLPNPDDPRLSDREFQWRIYKYARGPGEPGKVPNDPRLPGAAWHRDTTFVIEEGAGVGTVQDPRSMFWSAAGFAPGLYAADFGKNWVQKLYDTGSSTGFWEVDGADGQPFNGAVDVAVDIAGYVYVVDAGGRRVLRFGPDASYVQRVDIEPDDAHRTLAQPVAAAADTQSVYVADALYNEVIRYKRRP